MVIYKMKTRIAPTPSGFLHVGNAVSFLITYCLAKSENGKLLLRIDDLDRERYRKEYLEDIFMHSIGWASNMTKGHHLWMISTNFGPNTKG